MKRRFVVRITAAVILSAAAFHLQGCRVSTPQTDMQNAAESTPVQVHQKTEGEKTATYSEAEEKAEQSSEASSQVSEEDGREDDGESVSPIDGVKIIIGTDVHYLAEEYTDYGEAFQRMVDYGDGRLVTYMDQITDEFLTEVIEEQPEALILSGDLSSNGEKRSHEALAEKLRQVEEAGIPVLVIPGNHDINNTNAKGFQGDSTYPVEYTSPEEFAWIYRDYGYDEALSRDEGTLSYTYQLNDDIRLLMLDTCQYHEGYAKVGGAIMPDTYDWIETQLEDAWNSDMFVIPVAHHNLLDESEIYVQDCTIEHSSQLIEKLEGWEISLFLSGHLHVQHMMEEEGTYPIREIVTGSLTTPKCHYGILTYQDNENYDYTTRQVNVERWAREHGSSKMDLLEFDAYGEPFLRKVFRNQAAKVLQKIPEITSVGRAQMCVFYAKLNDYYYQGRAVDIRDEALKDPAFTLWQEKAYGTVLNEYILSILDDAVRDYNHLSVREGETVLFGQ